MTVNPRTNAALTTLNIPPSHWLPEAVRPLAEEAVRLRKQLSEAQVALGHLERSSTRDAAVAEDQRVGAQAVREGKAPPKVSAVQRHDAALAKAAADHEAVRQAMMQAVAEYDLAMRAEVATAYPQAQADLEQARADYEALIEALSAARERWLLQLRITAMWTRVHADPEGASVSLNTNAGKGQPIVIGSMELWPADVLAGLRTELDNADKGQARAERASSLQAASA